MTERFEHDAAYPQLSIMEVQLFAMHAELYGTGYDVPNVDEQAPGEEIPRSYKYTPEQEKIDAVQAYKDRHITDEVEEVAAIEVEYVQKWITERGAAPLRPHVIVTLDSQVETDDPKTIIKKKTFYFLSLEEGRARVVENFFDYEGRPLGFGLHTPGTLSENGSIEELRDRIRYMTEDDVQILRLLI